MNVAVSPIFRAARRTTYLTMRTASHASRSAEERDLDLALAGAAHLVMVVLDGDADGLEDARDLRPRVVEVVLRRQRVVAAVARDRESRAELVAPPVRLGGLDAVARDVHAVLVRDAVEEVELELRPPEALRPDAALLQALLGARRDRARVEEDRRAVVRLEDPAEEAERLLVGKGVEERGREIGYEDEVPGLYGPQARRTTRRSRRRPP